ncbi:MAG: DNA repair protein RadC [Treponema sp.]|nr:DNA repair protein RadC [Treponema sp.]
MLEKVKPDIREKTLKYGLQYPDDVELVMLIIGSGNRDYSVESLSQKIVDKLDSSNNEDVIKSLCSLKGVGEGKALAVCAALELGKRRSCHFGAHIKTPKDVVPFVKQYAISLQEHFLVVILNGGHEIIKIHVASVGTVNRTLIHAREIFGEAIRNNAAAVILVHNHPSGTSMPSEEDIESTEALLQASKIIGIPILDHIIIDRDSYFSFMEEGLINLTGE